MEKTNVEVVEIEMEEKENKVKEFFVKHKKKVFTGLGVVGAFVLGAIAHSKWTDDDDTGDNWTDEDDEECHGCENCTCGENDDVTED